MHELFNFKHAHTHTNTRHAAIAGTKERNLMLTALTLFGLTATTGGRLYSCCRREVTASPRGCPVTDLRGSETALWKEGIRSGFLRCLVSLAPRTQSYRCGHGSAHRSCATLHVQSGIRVTC